MLLWRAATNSRVADSFLRRLNGVLVFDTHHIVVACRAHLVQEGSPEGDVVPLPNRAKDPGTLRNISIWPAIQRPGKGQLFVVEMTMLQMNVVHCRSQSADHAQRIHLLPEQVARVDVGATDWTDGVS